MKILMLGWELPPHNSGGLGVACYQLCKQLAIQGVDIDFVLPYAADYHVDFMNVVPAGRVSAEQFMQLPGAYDTYCERCDSTECAHVWSVDLNGQRERYAMFVERHSREYPPDVIHAHEWLTFDAGVRAKLITGRPLIAHVHATEFDRSGEHHGNPLVHEIEYNGLVMADRIIAVSNATKDVIVREYGIPSDKIEVIHNSVDASELANTQPESTYIYLREMKKYGYKVVVSLGRLTVQKGLTYLLQAARQVCDIDSKVFFLLAGAGELRDELLVQAAELGIAQNVIFTGFVRGARQRDAYAIGDIFVMPSVSEPFGLTALEAACYGNALLLSKQAGVCEVLHSALKYDYWDTTKLANNIVAVTAHGELRQQLLDDARQAVSRLSWRDVADRCRALYDRYTARVEAGI